MPKEVIEGMLASPSDRDELVVQLFLRDGGQWGEIFRENGDYWIDLYLLEHEAPIRMTVSDLANALTQSVEKLRERLET